MPRPNVDSAVIKLERYKEPPVKADNEKLMFGIIRASFNQRRKTMTNSVCGCAELGITKEKSGEYVMSGKQEIQEQSQDEGLLR